MGREKERAGGGQDYTELVAGGIGRNKRSTSAPKQGGILGRNGEKTEYEKSRGASNQRAKKKGRKRKTKKRIGNKTENGQSDWYGGN